MTLSLPFYIFAAISYLLLYLNITQNWLSMDEQFGSFHIIILLVLLSAIVLSLIFHRSRLFFLLFTTLMMTLFIEYFDIMRHQTPPPPYMNTFGSENDFFILTFLPWLFIGLSFLKDRGIFTRQGVTIFLFTGLILLLYFATIRFQLAWISELMAFKGHLFSFKMLSDTTLISWILLLLLSSVLKVLHYKSEAIFWLITLGFILVAFLPKTVDTFIMGSFIASLITIYYIISKSYYMAYIDELTQLKGRRAMNEYMLRLSSDYTIVLGDIDHFKKFNDTYGHDVGDEVLKLVARELSKTGGQAEVFRWGGEEFALIFNAKDAAHATHYTDKVRQNIQAQAFILRSKSRPQSKPKEPKPAEKKEALHITMSFGVAQKQHAQQTPHDVLKEADKKLYQAKESGRNCVVQ